jgi:hypothetical protein
MAQPDWFVLIEQWVPRKMGQTGVTLPFLVGALALKAGRSGHLAARDVRQVLDEITTHPVDGYVTEVIWCHYIDAPVFTVTRADARDRIRPTVAVRLPVGVGESLVFGPNVYNRPGWGQDAAASFERLVADAAEPVSMGTYSRRPKQGTINFEHADFSEKERDYIRDMIMTE